jgi:hypothetical protein
MKLVQKLVDAGATPHWDWICETMREGHIALAEMLLQSGVERNILTMAAMGDVKRVTSRLRRVRADARLTANMNPASSRVTPLDVACSSNRKPHGHGRLAAQAQVAMSLVEHDADLNAIARYRGIGDATALFCACWSSENLLLVRCWTTERQPQLCGSRPRSAISNVTAWGNTTSPKHPYPLASPSTTTHIQQTHQSVMHFANSRLIPVLSSGR